MSRVLPAAATDEAAQALRAGLVVGIPTDTVYGLAVDPSQPGATGRLFESKSRPASVALPVLVSGVDQALSLAVAGPSAQGLMARWWPGALTVVLVRRPGIDLVLGGDEGTIGLRCPAHPVPLALAGVVGPLATTSANRHGGSPLETAQAVSAEIGPAVVLDGGTCRGAPSTVVDCTGPVPRLLRQGRIPWAEVLAEGATQWQS
ncbi:MAG: L-threonylcarbamoyladenylate synthase [Acidimicrobiales bacterium]